MTLSARVTEASGPTADADAGREDRDSRLRALEAAAEKAARRRRMRAILLNGTGLLVFVMAIFPVLWMVATSLRRQVDVQTPSAGFDSISFTIDNYRRVFERDLFFTAFRNSMLVTLLTVVVALFLAFLAAVAVSRFRFRGRTMFIVIVLLVQMVPAEALIVSFFRVLDGWNLINTIIGLTLSYLVLVLPFTIWTLRGFVDGIPRELEEAAMVDGASRLRAFFSVTLPLIAPGLVATGIFAFIQAWSDFIFALVIMNRPENQTLPVWLQSFNEGARGTDWGAIMAGSVLITIPVLVFFLLVHRRVTAGLTAGAVKG
jgi:N,N'-diacetylchitobiose transport system permease protein